MLNSPKEIEKELTRKKINFNTKKYQKKNPERTRRQRQETYQRHKPKRLKYLKGYREKNKDKINKYNQLNIMALYLVRFTLIKGNDLLIIPVKQLPKKLMEGWQVKSVDWSEILKNESGN